MVKKVVEVHNESMKASFSEFSNFPNYLKWGKQSSMRPWIRAPRTSCFNPNKPESPAIVKGHFQLDRYRYSSPGAMQVCTVAGASHGRQKGIYLSSKTF